jgi:hypothetical protein
MQPSLDVSVEKPIASDPQLNRPTLGSLSVPYVWPLISALAVIAVGWLVYGARRFDFYFDEWDWVDHSAHWTLNDYFVPHVVHWSTVPMLVYKALFETVGMRSYIPYLTAMALMHAAGALVLFALLRRSAGDALAFAGTVIFLFIGTGAQDIDWAFQVGFDGSVTFGLLGVYLLTADEAGRWRQVGGLVALLLGLGCSGIGLFYCVWAGVDNLLQKNSRRRLWVVGTALAVFGVWYLHYGRAAAQTDNKLFSLSMLRLEIGYIPVGIGNVVAGLLGRSSDYVGLVLPIAVGLLAVLLYKYRPVGSLVWAALVALVVDYGVTASGRAQAGVDEALQTRYVGVAAPFVLLITVEALRRVPVARHWGVPVFATVVTLSLVGNLVALRNAQHELLPGFVSQDQQFEALWLLRNAPGLDPNAIPTPGEAPTLTAEDYVTSREEYGTSLPTITLAQLADDNPTWINTVMRNVLPMKTAAVKTVPAAATHCTAISPAGGSVVLSVPDGDAVYFAAAQTEHVTVQYWYEGSGSGYVGTSLPVALGTALKVTLPDTGLGLTWHIALTSTASGQVCHAW